MGDDGISKVYRDTLERSLDEYGSKLNEMLAFYSDSMRSYSKTMENHLENIESYFKQIDFKELNQKTKNETVTKVGYLTVCFHIMMDL